MDSLFESKYGKLSCEYLYTVEINAIILFDVKSYGFVGSHEFCIRNDQVNDYILILKKMDSNLAGECKICDEDSDSFLSLIFKEKQLKISGQFGGSYEENFLRFSFMVDQTIIGKFIKALLNCLIN